MTAMLARAISAPSGSSSIAKLCSREFPTCVDEESCGAGSQGQRSAAACLHSEPTKPSHRRWPGYRSLLAVVGPQRIAADKDLAERIIAGTNSVSEWINARRELRKDRE